MTVTRIGHIAIKARDIEKTVSFYRDVLGFPEAFRMQNPAGDALGSVHIRFAHSTFIEIFPGGTELEKNRGADALYSHLCLEVPDAAAAQEELRARGAPIDVEVKRGFSRCIQFWTHDPDGNRIEFMELPPDCLQVAADKRLEETADL